jgi:hypothetical protein
MSEFRADELFTLIIDGKATYPLNLEFSLKPLEDNAIFKNPGIYSIHYLGELIYLGFSQNQDDIRKTRWVRQLATITIRGNNIQFSSKAHKALIKSELWPYYSHLNLEIENKDFQTSKNRVSFASCHKNEFLILDETVLKNFVFIWYPLPGHSNIESKCEELKKQYKPRCNEEFVPFNI